MICRDVLQLLHPFSDGELDLMRQVEIEEHLVGCADCAEQEKHLRSLRAALASPSLYHRAPAGLRERIQLATPAPIRVREPRTQVRQFLAIAAAVLLLIGMSGAVGVILSRAGTSADYQLAELVVASHVRSLQVEHLKDVVSTDRHTVKPWFRGKLDFAPQLPDLAPQEYPLSGGRLDYLTDRPVAALVYGRRSHAINVFTWHVGNGEEKGVRTYNRNGFHIRHWQRNGMTYWAISDLNDAELDEFVRLFQENSSE